MAAGEHVWAVRIPNSLVRRQHGPSHGRPFRDREPAAALVRALVKRRRTMDAQAYTEDTLQLACSWPLLLLRLRRREEELRREAVRRAGAARRRALAQAAAALARGSAGA
jgi:hypothetical protein